MVVIGQLQITTISGRNLRNCETFSKQDPYVSFKLGESKARTKTVRNGGTNPEWNETCLLEIHNTSDLKLKIKAYDEDLIGRDCIGENIIDISRVIKEGDFDAWFPIYSSNRLAGELYLELTYLR